jgi:DNA polymerase III subunit gamma/tau
MGYISFYRKWRPQTFDEIIGQEYNIQTLKNVLDGNRLSHSYIFCGPRGTGKTSTARILAKAINCIEGISSSPCNKCNSCRSISDGSNMDVIEIDAASNRGINEIRELREKVKYLPNELRKKVYIIDEIHMLTTEAFNALLKVLEEPPEHVIFIMATTEPNKVIPTIMSRCQRFDFYPIPPDLIKERLSHIAGVEKISITDTALDLVAKNAEGSLRDADGILEQLAAYSDEKIGPAEVVKLLGVVDIEVLFEFVDILASRDIKKGLMITDRIIRGNQGLKDFTVELIDHLYNLYTAKNYDSPHKLIDLSRDYLERYRRQADKLQNEEIDYYMEHFTELIKQINWGESSRTFFKSSVIRALNFIVFDDSKLEKKARAWESRLDSIERKVNGSIPRTEPPGPAAEAGRGMDIISRSDVEEPARDDPAGIIRDEDAAREIEESHVADNNSAGKKVKGDNEIALIESNMDRILEKLKKARIAVHAMFVEAGPGRIEDGILYFYLEENKQWHKDHLNKSVNSAIIASVINEVTGKKYGVRFETGDVREKNGKNSLPGGPPEEEDPPISVREPEEDYEEKGDAGLEKKAGKNDLQAAGKDGQKDPGGESGAGDKDIMEYFEKKFEIKE